MTKPIIEINNVSKKYRIGIKQPYYSLRDTLTNTIISPFKNLSFKPKDKNKLAKDEFWALKNISFKVMPGEVLGIIGRNGAGKSTLLKILSQITPPTSGEIKLRGRVASLLEVGTGFHPELTGRENIFLNGAILGMSQSEIKKKFEEIVEFAEISQFLDTPVKHYSSGMYTRLAFAIAAHLEPEILLIDEVLAVGDAQFQKKCLGKMGEISKQGRTVLFVSHNLSSIERLCSRAILLEDGRNKKDSRNIKSVINHYLLVKGTIKDKSGWFKNSTKYENPWFDPESFYIGDKRKTKILIPNNNDIKITIEGTIQRPDPNLSIGYALFNEQDLLLYWSVFTDISESNWPKLKVGKVHFQSYIPKRLLNEGSYRLELYGALHNKKILFDDPPSIFMKIEDGLSDSPFWTARRTGEIAPNLPWKIIQ